MKTSIKNLGKTLLAALIVGVSATACEDDFLEKTPVTALSVEAIQSENEIVALVNSAYDPLQWQVLNGSQSHMFPVMFQDIRADNCTSQWASFWIAGGIWDDLRLVQPNNASVNGLWTKWFTMVARANAAINVVENFENFTTDGLQDRLIGEAKFCRAFAYFELVKQWGDVPLITEQIRSTSDQLIYPRAPKAEVYAQIEQDLNEAAATLQTKGATEPGRATVGAALTLLAKAHLYQQEYNDVVRVTEEVMSLGYMLEPNYADNWMLENEYGQESIFEVGYVNGFTSFNFEGPQTTLNQGSATHQMFGFLFNSPIGNSAFGNSVPRQSLIDIYDDADLRKDATFITPETVPPDIGRADTANGIGTNVYQFFWTDPVALESKATMRKYRLPKDVQESLNVFSDSPLNEKVFRYADVLLMHAEAALFAGGDGLASLNMVIERAHGGDPSYNLASYTLEDVKNERRKELATEGWDRFSDLVRWGDAASVLAFKGFVPGRDELLPIPQTEIDLVGADVLTQNPGY
jgi:hypothetical protein